MQPVRMKAELATDQEGIRRLLLAMAPRMEARQPGLTAQLQQYRFDQPMRMISPKGETMTVTFEPLGGHTAVKVEVKPPYTKKGQPLGKWRGGFWRWRTRMLLKLMLKRAKLEVERQNRAPIRPEVLPPEA